MSGECKLKKKGNGVYWLFGFIFVWLGISIAYALLALVVFGPESNVNVFLFVEGAYLPAKIYFLFSALLGSIFLGCFSYYLFRELRMVNFEGLYGYIKEDLKNLEKQVKDYVEKKFAQISMNGFTLAENVGKMEEEVKIGVERIEKALDDWRNRHGILDKHSSDLKYLKEVVEDINGKLAPKPFLTLLSDVEKIVGVGEKTAKAFKLAGIENVQKLISEDPKTLAEKTGLSEGFVEKVQNAAKMLIVPGIKLKVVKCLQKAGIHSLEELARQSPMELYRLVSLADDKACPTLEELAYSVRAAQYYVSKNFNAYVPGVFAYTES